MAKVRVSRRLVVDASILHAAGGHDATADRAKACRDFLRDILGICHRVCLTIEINGEWIRHTSRFSGEWVVKMRTMNKIVENPAAPSEELRAEILAVAPDGDIARIMLKDALLIEAALAADNIVASLDETVGDHFARAAARISRLGVVLWVNPARETDLCLEWLRSGAKSVKTRQLKHRVPR